MSGSLPMAIDCRKLTYRYGKFTAVDDLTLQVQPGETMGLLGPNGAGKAALVRMLTTLTPVQQGGLRIFGTDSRDQTVDIRSNIGYAPDSAGPAPSRLRSLPALMVATRCARLRRAGSVALAIASTPNR